MIPRIEIVEREKKILTKLELWAVVTSIHIHASTQRFFSLVRLLFLRFHCALVACGPIYLFCICLLQLNLSLSLSSMASFSLTSSSPTLHKATIIDPSSSSSSSSSSSHAFPHRPPFVLRMPHQPRRLQTPLVLPKIQSLRHKTRGIFFSFISSLRVWDFLF